eukprot:scaffold18452_cov64-Phaeocystis_antarctica.AAC.1
MGYGGDACGIGWWLVARCDLMDASHARRADLNASAAFVCRRGSSSWPRSPSLPPPPPPPPPSSRSASRSRLVPLGIGRQRGVKGGGVRAIGTGRPMVGAWLRTARIDGRWIHPTRGGRGAWHVAL